MTFHLRRLLFTNLKLFAMAWPVFDRQNSMSGIPKTAYKMVTNFPVGVFGVCFKSQRIVFSLIQLP